MVLVEPGRVTRQPVREEGRHRIVRGAEIHPPVPRQRAARVGVRDKDGTQRGVEQDTVRGFRPDAVDRKQFGAQRPGRHCEQPVESAAKAIEQPLDKRPQPACLDVEVAGWANQLRQHGGRGRPQRAGRQPPRSPQVRDRALDIGPGGMLREDGADDRLERRARRPPALRSPAREQGVVQGAGVGVRL